MSASFGAEVRAYVFGQWAFEPRRLIDLLELADVSLIEGIQQRVRNLADPTVRANALAVIEARLSGKSIRPPVYAAPPARAESFQHATLARARRIIDPYRRSSALARLASLLDVGSRGPILDEALAAARAIPSEHWRAVAAGQVARVGSGSTTLRVLADHLQLEDATCRVHALADLLPYVPGRVVERLVDALLSACWETGDVDVAQQTLAQAAVSLPDGFLARAFEAASRVDPRRRAHALEALAPYLAPAQANSALGLLQDFDTYSRARALQVIAPRLSPRSADLALQLLGPPPAGEFEQRSWADTAVAIAPMLPDEALARLLAFVSALTDAYAVGKLIVGVVVRRSLGEQALNLALGIVRAIEWGFWRIELLSQLLPILPPSHVAEAISIARETADASSRVEGILKLVDRAPLPQRPDLIGDALAAAEAIQGESEQAAAFLALGPRLTEHQLSLAMVASQRMSGWAAWRVLAGLAPYLRGTLFDTALDLARQLAPGEFQSKALLALAVHLDGIRCSELLIEAMRSAQIGSVTSLAEIATELAERVPESVVPDVLSLARSVRWPAQRAGALLSLVDRLSGRTRSAVLLEALAAARAITSSAARSARAAALAEIASLSPEPARSQLFEEAIATASAREHVQAKGAILAAIAERYAGEPTLSALLETSLPPGRRPRPYSAAFLATQFEALDLDDQRSILEEAIDLIPMGTHILEDARTHRWNSDVQSPPARPRPPAYLWVERWLPGGMGAGSGDSGVAFVAPTRPPPRIVNTGFAMTTSPAAALAPSNSLRCGQTYYFWLEVGPPVAESIEVNPTALPEELPSEARLTVAIFGFHDEIQIFAGSDIGELTLHADGTVDVARQPADLIGISAESWLVQHRLLFPIQVPERPGTYRLRCCIYYSGLLVQSRLVSVRAMRTDTRSARALRSILDYTLASRLEPARLAGFETHDLSLMFNTEDRSTHGLRVFSGSGDQLFKSDATIDAQGLDDMIGKTRGALQMASWGYAGEWKPGKSYLYAGPPDLQRMERDLVRFAVWGYRLYDALINPLAGGYSAAEQLGQMMLQRRVVQIALKQSARMVIPAALMYDRRLDTGREHHNLCSDFIRALKNDEPLGALPCFAGMCSSREDDSTVCPGGFWGYRHALGMPVSIASALDLPGRIGYSGAPKLAVSVATDPCFIERVPHERALRALRSGLGWSYADTRAQTLELLKSTHAQLVYFYCHGGAQNNIPYIMVGYQEQGITRDNIRSKRIRWNDPRPIVFINGCQTTFINGCQTTAVRPEMALDFVSAFVENAQASGVVGTEITVFEPFARRFAEECLARLLDGVPIGEAVRQARLVLLQQANPLGLVYIPFAIASLRLAANTTLGP